MGEEVNIQRHIMKACLASRSTRKERRVLHMVALDSMFVCFLTYSFEVGGKSYVKNVSSSEKPKKLLLPGSLKREK